ncbi:hypothetical protein [Shewanella pneumatophori]|uniref:Uncharacterized protein n=1 Tax=Shewanella pneumatophori TaxID=314092 RepID=A0A9X1ZL37_9GAMM|nr:hypothetical protein [Shewanella pneumatophori]MCL1139828.1 hypothetical protein [Shewanella pneumatophori]
MKISSISLELASGQTQDFGAVTCSSHLKQQLNLVMQTVVFEEEESEVGIGAAEVIQASSSALTMPMIVVRAKVRQREITFTYDLLSEEEGLLALYYTNDKGRIKRQKEFGFVSFDELVGHLQRLLSQSENTFIEYYFPKQTSFSQVIKYASIVYICAACFGLVSFVFMSDLIWRNDFFQSAFFASGITYVISLPILLFKAFSDEARQRAAQIGQSVSKQVIAILVGNIILSCAVVAGGSKLLHLLTAKPIAMSVAFSDKRQDYWGKSCKGGVNIEHFFGAVCLENKAYWKVIRPGMQAVIQGESSAVAFDIKAIELE